MNRAGLATSQKWLVAQTLLSGAMAANIGFLVWALFSATDLVPPAAIVQIAMVGCSLFCGMKATNHHRREQISRQYMSARKVPRYDV